MLENIVRVVIIFSFGIPLLAAFSLIESYYDTPKRETPEWVKDGKSFFSWLFDIL